MQNLASENALLSWALLVGETWKLDMHEEKKTKEWQEELWNYFLNSKTNAYFLELAACEVSRNVRFWFRSQSNFACMTAVLKEHDRQWWLHVFNGF